MVPLCEGGVVLMWLYIDRDGDLSLIRQVYEQIKGMILDGNLQEGEKLPSTRWLSEDLKISRNVVLEAYEQLMSEGYINSRHGSGTMVSKGVCYRRTETVQEIKSFHDPNKHTESNLIDFRSGIPALDLFPQKDWGRLFNQVFNEVPSSAFSYCSSEGIMKLRQALSKYLFRVRGINCSPEQIMITSGSTQGLSLISKLLFCPNSEIIAEDPIHYGLLKVISSYGYLINAVPVDNSGLRTDLIESSNNVSFVYVTPSHQFPLGGILPIQRRIELIKFAKEKDCYIVEDDYDSEYRYEGQPVSSLYELEPNQVIYIGSFSKILAPALRLGYIILPPSLIPRYLKLKLYSDVHTEALSQHVLAQFINNGKLERHIWKMKKEYNKKRQAVISNLSLNFPGKFQIEGQAAGLHLVASFNNISFTEEVLKKIQQESVKVYPVEKYAIHKGNHTNKIILGYGHLSINEIEEGIKRIKKGISK